MILEYTSLVLSILIQINYLALLVFILYMLKDVSIEKILESSSQNLIKKMCPFLPFNKNEQKNEQTTEKKNGKKNEHVDTVEEKNVNGESIFKKIVESDCEEQNNDEPIELEEERVTDLLDEILEQKKPKKMKMKKSKNKIHDMANICLSRIKSVDDCNKILNNLVNQL